VWWLGLISGIAMVISRSGPAASSFTTKAYTLLIFAGIWALMQGITDIARAVRRPQLRNRL
jgi:uncharacterized membrane protein HdeD (DUF308 family)